MARRVTIMAMLAVSALCVTRTAAETPPLRLEVPRSLPDHPRVFCTRDDLDRVHALLDAGDAYALACQRHLLARAEDALSSWEERGDRTLQAADIRAAARLAEAFVLGGRQELGDAARDIMLEAARQYPSLETTRARGRLTANTLTEGPVAIDAAMAYDLLAGSGQFSARQRARIERDFFRIMGIECGRKCHHRDSSNWRSWALCILACCGYASGDLELIDEAVNGYWDESRAAYLYGFVQQLTHSIFSDGIHWERSIGYTYYTAGALMPLLVAAENSGLDLWRRELPGMMAPFPGCAPHEEFGPPGARRFDAFLLTPFYYAFPNGSCALIGDSGTRSLRSHPIYELAWRRYRDPRFAWIIGRDRADRGGAAAPPGWWFWFPAPEAKGDIVRGIGREGGGLRLVTDGTGARAAIVTDVRAAASEAVTVSGWVRAVDLRGGRAHIRCNLGSQAFFSESVTASGDWREVAVTIPAASGGDPADRRRIRIHVFLEGGGGEVIWDEVRVLAGERVILRGDFDNPSVDGRALSFWSLIHGAADVSAAAFDITEDTTIGVSGRHISGSTLFPVGGFAVLRDDPVDLDAPAVLLNYGPYGSGHDHPDRLHISVYGLGEILCPDGGSWGYDNPMHLTWANTTVAHNTVVRNMISQEPQGDSKSIWASERGDQRVYGELKLFHPGADLKAVRAICGTAYPGTELDRTVCVIDGVVVDIYRIRSDSEATFDLPVHGPGTVTEFSGGRPVPANVFSERGYAHLTDVRQAPAPAGTVTEVLFVRNDARLRLLQYHPDGGVVYTGGDPEGRFPRSSVVITRRRARDTYYASVLEPFREQPRVRQMSVDEKDGQVTVRLTRRDGSRETFDFPADSAGTLEYVRRNARGETVHAVQAAATDRWGETIR